MPESSQNNWLLDAGRYGLPRLWLENLFQTFSTTYVPIGVLLRYLLHPCSRVLGFGILRRSTAYINIGVSRHFPHPVGRFHQHDDKDTYSVVPQF